MSVTVDEEGEVREIALEAGRHLTWLLDAGMRELEPASAPAQGHTRERPRAPAAVHADLPPSPPTVPGAPPSYTHRDKGCGSAALLSVRERLGECVRCKLSRGRTKLVFGVGAPEARLMFVGEGPGADEDAQGEPFVGKAGQLLTRMIEAMGFRREEVYIANVVKCRPPENRDPEADEIAACEGFLREQIEAVRPAVVVALGRFAVQTLLRDPTAISKQRGAWRVYQGVKLMPTFHPAYLLRNPAEKKKAWEDLQLVMRELGRAAPPLPNTPPDGAG